MPDSTLEEIFKYFYLAYTAYIDEGIIAVFDKDKKEIKIWIRLSNGMWRLTSAIILGEDFNKLNYYKMCEEAAMAIHRYKKPW